MIPKTSIGLLALMMACMQILHSQSPVSKDQFSSRENISFLSSGVAIKGWLYLPKDTSKGKPPVVVMAPGVSGVKECNYDVYAEKFAKEGLAVVLFDYPNFGESGGNIRQEIDPWEQVESYRDAISFATTDKRLNASKIGVWGGSYAGGHAIVVSALDSRVTCFVAMTPYLGGYEVVSKIPEANRAYLASMFNKDRLNRIQNKAPMTIPVVTNQKGVFCFVQSINAYNFTESFKAYAPNWKNELTLKSLEMQLEYQPGSYIQRTGTKPKLIIAAKNDELIAQPQILAIFQQAAEPKSLLYVEGHHFSPYQESLNEAAAQSSAFFKKYLFN